VVPNVSRSAGLAFASVTTTPGASEANGNGSPSRPDLLEKGPLPLFRKIGSKARGGCITVRWLGHDARSRARTQRGRAPNSSVLAQLVDLIQTKHRLGLD